MEVYVQSINAGQYLKEKNVWVPDRKEALKFRSAISALDYCSQYQIKDIRLVLANSSGPEFDLRLPVQENRNQSTRKKQKSGRGRDS